MPNNIDFTPETYQFETGLTVEVNQDKIIVQDDSGSSSVDSHNLNNLTYQEYWEARISPAGLGMRFHGISIAIIIILETVVGAWTETTLSVTLFLIIMNVAIFLFAMVDIFLELRIIDNIVVKYFSDHVYLVSIGNSNGNNVEFYAQLTEKDKIIALESQINELKKLSQQPNKSETPSNKSNLDELKKLGELYQLGILTEQEFNDKKQELLNK